MRALGTGAERNLTYQRPIFELHLSQILTLAKPLDACGQYSSYVNRNAVPLAYRMALLTVKLRAYNKCL